MTTEQAMKAALQHYIDGFNAGDAEAILSLFAEHATLEDPVGGPVREGRQAISEFCQRATASGAKLTLVAPITGSHSNAAAMAFIADTVRNGKRVNIQAIDVMTFDDSGKIASMRAYWGPEDLKIL
ncbi:MAG: nuclear transport factor 2 family protein [Chloroflexi bacterium]|nr:nuclear transport factor 2 family protein [Chloroflexota bacterium]